jgi:hypothetical protein
MGDIRVQDEQGNVHVFPDGSTPEMIAKAMNVKPPSSATPPAQRTWTDSVVDFAKSAWNQVNPVAGVQGMAQATAHPIDTLKNDAAARQQVYNKAEEAFKKGDYTGGAAHLLYSMVPLMGPQLDQAGEQFVKGETAKGLGASVGMGLNLAAPEVIKGAVKVAAPVLKPIGEGMQNVGREMYQSALKPRVTTAPEKVAGMIDTGLENRIPITKGGIEKLGGLIDDLNQKITDNIASRPGRTVNKYRVAGRLNDPINQFSAENQVNPVRDIRDITRSGQEFLDTHVTDMPASQAQAIKVGTYQQLKGKYGQLGNAEMEAQKALARGIKEELAQQFPELNALNAAEGKALDLQPALEKAVQRIGNHQLIGLGTPAAGAATGVVTGSAKLAATAAAVKAVLDNPMVKSKLAQQIYWGGKKLGKGITINAANARVQGLLNQLGNSVSAETGTGQTAEQQ